MRLIKISVISFLLTFGVARVIGGNTATYHGGSPISSQGWPTPATGVTVDTMAVDSIYAPVSDSNRVVFVGNNGRLKTDSVFRLDNNDSILYFNSFTIQENGAAGKSIVSAGSSSLSAIDTQTYKATTASAQIQTYPILSLTNNVGKDSTFVLQRYTVSRPGPRSNVGYYGYSNGSANDNGFFFWSQRSASAATNQSMVLDANANLFLTPRTSVSESYIYMIPRAGTCTTWVNGSTSGQNIGTSSRHSIRFWLDDTVKAVFDTGGLFRFNGTSASNSVVDIYADNGVKTCLSLRDTRTNAAGLGPYISFTGKSSTNAVLDLSLVGATRANASTNNEANLVFFVRNSSSALLQYMQLDPAYLTLYRGNGLRLFDSDNSNSIIFQTPATGSLTANYTLTLPVNDGDAGNVLRTDGSGALSWVTPQSYEDSAVSYSTSQTIPNNVASVTVTGTNSVTLTLPDAAADGANYAHNIHIKSLQTGGGNITVQRAGSNVIYAANSSSSVTSVNVTQGSNIELISNGGGGANGYWFVH